MVRKALIVYCTNTASGPLAGPLQDALNFQSFLMSAAGGHWQKGEIVFLKNPTSSRLKNVVKSFLHDADYTFTVFSGHGFIDAEDGYKQYIELSDISIPISSLVSNAPRQTIIIDACRGYFSKHLESLEEETSAFIGDVEAPRIRNTRKIFEAGVLKADKGLTILYAASQNETALDTPSGGAYLFSLLAYSQYWARQRTRFSQLPLKTAHLRAIPLMRRTFDTLQKPSMNREKRLLHFPLAVKYPGV